MVLTGGLAVKYYFLQNILVAIYPDYHNELESLNMTSRIGSENEIGLYFASSRKEFRKPVILNFVYKILFYG